MRWLEIVETAMLSESSENDAKIDELLHDWVISSLSAHEKRKQVTKELLNMSIDPQYRAVPSDTLYRFQLDNASTGLIESWSYSVNGAKKIASYYAKSGLEGKIISKPVSEANVLICIPTFYRLTKIFSGRQFMRLVQNEREVLVIS